MVGHSVAQRRKEIGVRMALGTRTINDFRLMANRSVLWVMEDDRGRDGVGRADGTAGLSDLLK